MLLRCTPFNDAGRLSALLTTITTLIPVLLGPDLRQLGVAGRKEKFNVRIPGGDRNVLCASKGEDYCSQCELKLDGTSKVFIYCPTLLS